MRKYEKMYLYFCIGNSVFRETLQASLSHAGFYYINADKTSTYAKYRFSAPRPEELDKICTSYNLLKDYYPVFSKSDDVEEYIKLVKEMKESRIKKLEKELETLKFEQEKEYKLEEL